MENPTQILVVGGRTTGLTMACELARHGAPVRIIDKSDGIDPHVRATLLHSRSLEIFHDLGIVDEVLAKGVKVRGMKQYANGRLFNHVTFGGVDSPFPWGVALGQNDVEAILERLLHRLGVTVERSVEMIASQQTTDRVEATLRHANGRDEEITTPWLVGCDGAHSIARHLYCEGFPGETDQHQYLIADAMVDADVEQDMAHIFLTDEGALFFFPLPEERTLVFAAVHEHRDPATNPPTLDDIQVAVTARGPAGAGVRDPRWLTRFQINYRMAIHYRHGRVLLAGDAAHIHSPVGGQGMNTGIQDAYNLAWKLALVANGRTSAKVLDSYEKERRDVGRDVVRATKSATDSLVGWTHLPPDGRKQLERHMLVPETERLHNAQHSEELDLDYRKSPICIDQAGDATADYPHAGAQARDAGPLECEGRTLSLFELLRGIKHTLLVFPGADGGWPLGHPADFRDRTLGGRGDLLNTYVVRPEMSDTGDIPPGVKEIRAPESVLERLCGGTQSCVYLIRPDGYVGYRSVPPSAARLRDYLEQVF